LYAIAESQAEVDMRSHYCANRWRQLQRKLHVSLCVCLYRVAQKVRKFRVFADFLFLLIICGHSTK